MKPNELMLKFEGAKVKKVLGVIIDRKLNFNKYTCLFAKKLVQSNLP